MNKDNILKIAAVVLFGGLFWVFSQNRMRKLYAGNGDGGPLPDDGEPGIGEGDECGAGPFTNPLDLEPYGGDDFANPFVYLKSYALQDPANQSANTDAVEQWYKGSKLQVINPCDGTIKYDLNLETIMNAYYAGDDTLVTQTTDIQSQSVGSGSGEPPRMYTVTQFKFQLQNVIARGIYEIVFSQGENPSPQSTTAGIEPDGTYEGEAFEIYYSGVVPSNSELSNPSAQF